MDRLARFQREAQLLASLNHPHIAAIYGVEEAHGIRQSVLYRMELELGRALRLNGPPDTVCGGPDWQADGLIEDYAHYSRGEASEVAGVVPVGGVRRAVQCKKELRSCRGFG